MMVAPGGAPVASFVSKKTESGRGHLTSVALLSSRQTHRLMRLLMLCATFFLTTSAFAQDRIAVAFDQVDEHGISIEELEATHGSALHADTALAVFPTQQREVIDGWRRLLTEFASHLRANDFEWAEPLRGFHRFYFTPDGRIERVIYRMPMLEGERASRYGVLLDEFARSYRFPLVAETPFAQCSPVTLAPPQSE